MWGRKYSIIAHEVAHITCKDHKTEMYPYSPHGPLFVSIVMEYYIAMGISSKNRAISSAIDMKVDYAWEPDDYRIQSTKHSLSSVGFDIK